MTYSTIATTNEGDSQTPQFKVKIQNQQLSYPISVLIDEDLTAPNMFEIVLTNWDEQKSEWKESDLLELGNEVEIFMGYRKNMKKLMLGELTGIEPDFKLGEVPRLTIRGYDYSYPLLKGEKTRTFTDITDSDIASKIAKEYGLRYKGEQTEIELDYVLQHNQTDWEFLLTRAARIGYVVYVREKDLYFHRLKRTEEPTVTLEQSRDNLNFYCRLSSLTQVKKIEVSGWKQEKKKAFVVGQPQSHAGPKDPVVRLLHPVINSDQATQIARGQSEKMALSYISGEITCIGRTDLQAGMTVNIQDVGKQFNGIYYITTVTHTYNSIRGYRTALTVRRNAT
ncbi:MAG: phage late control D family protein [Hormoscilla sp. GUM202]|nr:phage late control D family protein [Hormoscilla sp. GUM202]